MFKRRISQLGRETINRSALGTVFLFVVFMQTSLVFASEEAVTSDGRIVILKNDGTWEYEKQQTASKNGEFIETTVMDIIIDKEIMENKMVQVQSSIMCLSHNYCVLKDDMDSTTQIQIEIDKIDRIKRKMILTNCSDFMSDCPVLVQGKVNNGILGISVHATDIFNQ